MEPPFIFLHCRYWSAVPEWCPLALRCNEKNSALMEHIGKWNTRSPLKNWTFKRKFQKMGLCVMWHVPIVFSLHWTKSRNSEYFMLPTGRNSAVLLLCLCLPSYQTLSWHHEIQERSQCKGSSRAPSWKFGHSLIHFSNQLTNQPKSLPKITHWAPSCVRISSLSSGWTHEPEGYDPYSHRADSLEQRFSKQRSKHWNLLSG